MICFDRKKANLFLIQLIVCTDIHNDGSKCGEPPVFNVQLNTIIFFIISFMCMQAKKFCLT